jgi:asparagine synthase (glutamine-hydrolysing)
MINQYFQNQSHLTLKSDLAGELPIYLYWPQDKSLLLYSNSITVLLDDDRVPKPLTVSDVGISFLLQSSVVPPPKTAYQDIYIVGIGDTAEVKTVNNKVEIDFKHKFPFMNANRLKDDELQPDEDLILNMLVESVIGRIDKTKPTFLFHSAGKDSNTIALALAEAGLQDKVTLITHKSKGAADESEISAKIAKQLGFKHRVLYEVDTLEAEHKEAINDYFINAPFPCTDNVTLAYPLYVTQVPELKGANIIFGDGNDSHMISPPTKREELILPYARWISKFSNIRKIVNSESKLNTLLKTPAEWFGMGGLSYKDSKNIFLDSSSVYGYWAAESRLRADWDDFDFKSDIYSTRSITEKMIRKLHNFVDVNHSQIILPFADAKVAEYFGKMPENYLFDRKLLKNKIVLRDMLKTRMSLDSDKLGKMEWSYDSSSIVQQNWDDILQELQNCKLWDKTGLSKVVNRLKASMEGNNRSAIASGRSGRLIYRVYLLSAWYNRNKYLK